MKIFSKLWRALTTPIPGTGELPEIGALKWAGVLPLPPHEPFDPALEHVLHFYEHLLFSHRVERSEDGSIIKLHNVFEGDTELRWEFYDERRVKSCLEFVKREHNGKDITEQNGRVTFWFPDGSLRAQGTAQNFKKTGNWLISDTGGILSYCTYREDELVGDWFYPIQAETYDKDISLFRDRLEDKVIEMFEQITDATPVERILSIDAMTEQLNVGLKTHKIGDSPFSDLTLK